MLRSANDATIVRLFWRITLDNFFFLTRLLRSYCKIMASCRLHSQTVALCQCTEAMSIDLHHVYGTTDGGM